MVSSLRGAKFLIAAVLLPGFIIANTSALPTPIGDWKVQPISDMVDNSPPFNSSVIDAICSPDAASEDYHVFNVGAPDESEGLDYGLTITTMLADLSRKHKGGILVKFTGGIYTMKTPIIVPSRSCIMGVGSGQNGTKLLATGKISGALIRSETSTHICVKGISIDTYVSYELAYGLWFTLCNYVHISDIRITRVKTDGIRIEGSGSRWAYHSVLNAVMIYDVGRYGVVITQCGNVHMDGISVNNVRRYGVLLSAGDKNVHLTGGEINGAEIGVVMKQGRGQEGPRGVRVKDVKITGARESGIWIKRTMDVQLTNVDIVGGMICYRINQSSMEKSGGNCTAKRGVVGNIYHGILVPFFR